MASITEQQLTELTADQIRRAAANLPLEEREDLTGELVRSVEVERGAVEQSWLDVAQRRLERIRNGTAETTPHDDVMQLVDADLDAIDAESQP
ncbi:MAG: addiction module protein [Planctomycetaceae bacterium]